MQPRWQATVWYRVADGQSVDVILDLEELEDLHDHVEAGPHFDTVEKIDVIRVNHVDGATLTVAEAKTL
jgi:hypothetical protein